MAEPQEIETQLQEQAIELVRHANTDSLIGCFIRRKLANSERQTKTGTKPAAVLETESFQRLESDGRRTRQNLPAVGLQASVGKLAGKNRDHSAQWPGTGFVPAKHATAIGPHFPIQ